MANWDQYKIKFNATDYTFKNRQINSVVESIMKDFEDNPSYFDVTINDDDRGIQIFDDSSSSEKVNDVKAFLLKPGETISIGDVVNWDGDKWLVVSTEMFSKIYYKGTIQKTNNSLKFYYPPLPNQNSILCTIPCIVTSKISLGSSENRFMTLPDGNIMVIAPNNSDTLNIYHGQRFVLGRSIYRVDNLDDISVVGLLNIKMSQTQKNGSDDMVNRIAVQNVATTTTVTDTSGGGW